MLRPPFLSWNLLALNVFGLCVKLLPSILFHSTYFSIFYFSWNYSYECKGILRTLWNIINSLMMEVPIIWKPVYWFVFQISGLVSTWPLLDPDVFWYRLNGIGAQKKCAQKVLVTLFPYIFHVKTKWNIVHKNLKVKTF